jgi:iron complex transport system permease protein
MAKHSFHWVLPITTFLFVILSLMMGSSRSSLGEIIRAFQGQDPPLWYIIVHLRIPRTIAALCCGAILGLSGAVFQAVLKNPMADPYVLGISSGGSLGAAIGAALGAVSLTIPALIGGLGASLFILAVSLRHQGQTRLILSGVAVTYLCSSLLTLIMLLEREQYQRIMFWTLGSFSASTFRQAAMAAVLAILMFPPLWRHSKELDMMLLDSSSALSLGLDIRRYRLLFLLLPTIAVSVCVASFGVIGFIGLLAPHIARLLSGPKHHRLLPASAACGSLLLLASDIICRVVLPTGEMPVGVITALVGTPLFLMMLHRGRYQYG